MRNLLIILLICPLLSFGQIIVHSKHDKRYISYKDSLNKYNKFLWDKVYYKQQLDECTNLSDFLNVSNNLGFTNVVTGDELLISSFTCGLGTWSCWLKKVSKPKVVVIYKPLILIDSVKVHANTVRIEYYKEKTNGIVVMDSCKSHTTQITYIVKHITH